MTGTLTSLGSAEKMTFQSTWEDLGPPVLFQLCHPFHFFLSWEMKLGTRESWNVVEQWCGLEQNGMSGWWLW